MLTRQQTFTKVATHLLQQNKRSAAMAADGTMRCAYRGDDSTMCAAGRLIDDEHYYEELENVPVWDDDVEAAVIASGVAEEDMEMVTELQDIHDEVKDTSMWREALAKLATKYELEMVS